MDGSLLSFVSRLTTPPAIGVRNNLVLPTRFLALALCNGRSNDASPSDSFAGFPDDAAAPDAEDVEDAAVSPLASPAAAAPTSALAPLLPRARLAKTHDDDDEDAEDADVDAPTVIVAPCRCRPPITDAPPLHRGAACALPSADLAPPLPCPRRRPVVNPPSVVVVVTVVVVVVKHPCISFFY